MCSFVILVCAAPYCWATVCFYSLYTPHSDLCRPDVRHESGASLSLMKMRDAVVQSAVHSMDYLLSVCVVCH